MFGEQRTIYILCKLKAFANAVSIVFLAGSSEVSFQMQHYMRCNVSVKSKLQHPPPPGIPRAFDVFSCPGGGNLINLIFPGAGI